MKLSVDRLVRISALAALAVAVSVLSKMQPSLNLFHLGPIVILTTALLFGPLEGALVGSISMTIFDIFFYRPVSAPKTLVSYFLFGLVAGYIALHQRSLIPYDLLRYIIAVIIGGVFFSASYFVFNMLFFGGIGYAQPKIWGTVILTIMSLAAVPLALILEPYVRQLKK